MILMKTLFEKMDETLLIFQTNNSYHQIYKENVYQIYKEKLDTISILIDPSRNSQFPIYLLSSLPLEVVMVFEDEEAGRRVEDLPNPKQHHVHISGF